MLVSLANNSAITANASSTFTYSPNSLQKVFIRVEDASWEQCSVTVQIGSVTICNGINLFGLTGYSLLQADVDMNLTGTTSFVSLDFGSHQCTDRDNLYVTVQAGANNIDAVDVSAQVDEPGQLPLRLTQYSDSTFVSPANLMGICWASSNGVIEEVADNIEIRTPVSASSPSFISTSSYFQANQLGIGGSRYYGLLNQSSTPLETSYNYTSSTVDRILTVEQMPSSQEAEKQSATVAKIRESQKSV